MGTEFLQTIKIHLTQNLKVTQALKADLTSWQKPLANPIYIWLGGKEGTFSQYLFVPCAPSHTSRPGSTPYIQRQI